MSVLRSSGRSQAGPPMFRIVGQPRPSTRPKRCLCSPRRGGRSRNAGAAPATRGTRGPLGRLSASSRLHINIGLTGVQIRAEQVPPRWRRSRPPSMEWRGRCRRRPPLQAQGRRRVLPAWLLDAAADAVVPPVTPTPRGPDRCACLHAKRDRARATAAGTA